MATSYANPCGSGDRRAFVQLQVTPNYGSRLDLSLDGDQTTNAWFFNGGSSNILEFWFPSKKIIDEARFYQQNATAHGTWKWQGGNDRLAWTDLGGTFTLGGVATQTLATLAGNTTGYIFYRMVQVSGTASSSPWIFEFEFKIDEAGGGISYLNPLGSGNRTNTIAVTSSGIAWLPGTPSTLVDGNLASVLGWSATTNAGSWVQFDLGLAVVVQQARFYFDRVSDQGAWKLQGSPDASAWTDLSDVVALGAAPVPAAYFVTCFGGSNTVAYRYVRLLGVSGSRNNAPFLLEVEFMVSTGAASPDPNANAYMKAKQGNKHIRTDENGSVKVTPVTAGSATGPLTPFAHVACDTDATGALKMAVITLNPPLGPLTDLANLRVCTDENEALLVAINPTGSLLGPLTNLGNLRARTDARGSLVVVSPAPGSLNSAPSPTLNLRGRTDENGALIVTGLV